MIVAGLIAEHVLSAELSDLHLLSNKIFKIVVIPLLHMGKLDLGLCHLLAVY